MSISTTRLKTSRRIVLTMTRETLLRPIPRSRSRPAPISAGWAAYIFTSLIWITGWTFVKFGMSPMISPACGARAS
jgi:hypothetical protein